MTQQSQQPSATQRTRSRRKRLRFLIIAAAALVALVAAIVFAASILFKSDADYVGSGKGEVLITVSEGESACGGIDADLESQGVVKSAKTFCNYVLKQSPEPVFQIGTFRLAKQMSASAALAALLNPKNKVELSVTIIEGSFAEDAFKKISEVTKIPLDQFEQAAIDHTSYGVPASAPSIEGFLFPATYVFEPGQTAEQIIQIMVDRMMQALDEHGVPVDQRLEIVTMASIIQREAGSNPDDFYKVSRVFWNRLSGEACPTSLLQSDATVSYGTGNTHTVWTQESERKDGDNLYNTYKHEGLPIGPIGLPGDLAIDAALQPAEGPWCFFVPVNLKTGETHFSVTQDEHDAAANELAKWCTASRARGETYCD